MEFVLERNTCDKFMNREINTFLFVVEKSPQTFDSFVCSFGIKMVLKNKNS